MKVGSEVNLTKRNHYNPCFWTAHWSPAYFDLVRRNGRSGASVRDQKVYVLNVKSTKIYPSAVSDVHYDKGMGLAEITPEGAKGFCKRNFPGDYERFCEEMAARPEVLVLDFENILSCVESSDAYATLLEVIRKGHVGTLQKKGHLSAFLAMHQLRSHSVMNSMVEFSELIGVPKFEHFWWLKHFISNADHMFEYAIRMAAGHWRFYRMDRDTFPLTDSPLLLQPSSLMIALSPRLLLEIDRTDRSCESGWTTINYISPAKLDEFRRRTITNTFRQIIFGHKGMLEDWRMAPEFAERHAVMSDAKNYNAMVMKNPQGELWHVNAHANAMR